MGRVIKNVDQSDVTEASLDDEFPTEGSDRIPADAVSTPEDEASPEATPSSENGVFQAQYTHASEAPVVVDADAVETPSPPPDAPEPSQSAAPSSEDTVPSRTDAEWQEHLEDAIEAARADGYEEGRKEGYEAGYDEGYEDAETEMRDEYEVQREQLIGDLRRFDALWEEYIDESETMLVDLSLRLAETIVDAPLTESMRRASEEALLEAVSELASAPPLTITVHPVDYQRLRESGLTERLNEKYDDLTLDSDPEYDEGDWSVSSPIGVIRRLRNEVVDTLRSELRLTHSDSSSGSE